MTRPASKMRDPLRRLNPVLTDIGRLRILAFVRRRMRSLPEIRARFGLDRDSARHLILGLTIAGYVSRKHRTARGVAQSFLKILPAGTRALREHVRAARRFIPRIRLHV